MLMGRDSKRTDFPPDPLATDIIIGHRLHSQRGMAADGPFGEHVSGSSLCDHPDYLQGWDQIYYSSRPHQSPHYLTPLQFLQHWEGN